MEKLAFVNNLYDRVIDAFIAGLEAEDIDAAKEAYKTYLHRTYDSLFDDIAEDEYDLAATTCVKREKLTHIQMSSEEKLAFLFPDAAFQELLNVSLELAELARAKKVGSNFAPSRRKEEYIEELERLSNAVSPSFKLSAERALSEALMDANFLFGDDGNQSFRTALI